MGLRETLREDIGKVVHQMVERVWGVDQQAVERFLSVAKNVAARIDAFAQLELEEGFERDFFTERFATHLFGKLYFFGKVTEYSPDKAWDNPTHNRSKVRRYLSKRRRIDDVLLEEDSPARCLLKRYLDGSASELATAIVEDESRSHYHQRRFGDWVTHSSFAELQRGVPWVLKKPPYTPPTQTFQKCSAIFNEYRTNIAAFREEFPPPFMPPSTSPATQ